jgi:adenylate cyclase
MDRIWQWTWDRYGARYSWAVYVAAFPVSLVIYLFWSFLIVGVEQSSDYVQAAVVTVVAVLVLHCVMVLADRRRLRLLDRWAAGQEVDRATALEASYTYARREASSEHHSTQRIAGRRRVSYFDLKNP